MALALWPCPLSPLVSWLAGRRGKWNQEFSGSWAAAICIASHRWSPDWCEEELGEALKLLSYIAFCIPSHHWSSWLTVKKAQTAPDPAVFSSQFFMFSHLKKKNPVSKVLAEIASFCASFRIESFACRWTCKKVIFHFGTPIISFAPQSAGRVSKPSAGQEEPS